MLEYDVDVPGSTASYPRKRQLYVGHHSPPSATSTVAYYPKESSDYRVIDNNFYWKHCLHFADTRFLIDFFKHSVTKYVKILRIKLIISVAYVFLEFEYDR